MDKIYDLIIVGGGPAGTAAAVYAARKRVNTLMVTSDFGGQSVVSEDIQNWIGDTHVSGSALASRLEAHVKEYAGNTLEIKSPTKVDAISKENNIFKLKLSSGEFVQSKTVLITTGSKRRQLTAKNADIFEHKGLTYCASCDGLFFADQDVIVVGAGNAAFESALQLSAYCKSVKIFARTDTLRADEITIQAARNDNKIEIVTNVEMQEIVGDKQVTGVIYKNKKTDEIINLSISGIFVEIGQTPNTDFLNNICNIDNLGRIGIDPWTQKTSLIGLWAAGDCTNIKYHQNNIAAGQGVTALEDIYQYLQINK